MPVYGDMILSFPELLKTYEVFKMKPRVGAGYGPRYDKRKVRGYWSEHKQGEMGIMGGLRTPDYQATFWVQDDFLTKQSVVDQQDFVEVKGRVYEVIKDQDFSHEGGFSKCLMQVLAGPTDQQVPNTKVKGVIENDY